MDIFVIEHDNLSHMERTDTGTNVLLKTKEVNMVPMKY